MLSYYKLQFIFHGFLKSSKSYYDSREMSTVYDGFQILAFQTTYYHLLYTRAIICLRDKKHNTILHQALASYYIRVYQLTKDQ